MQSPRRDDALPVAPPTQTSSIMFSAGREVSSSGTPLMSVTGSLEASYENVVRSSESTAPDDMRSTVQLAQIQSPMQRSRGLSTVHAPNLHPAATPLSRFSFIGAPESLSLPPPVILPEQIKPHLSARLTCAQSSVFVPNIGGYSSGEEDTDHNRPSTATRIARLRSHSFTPQSSSKSFQDSDKTTPALPHRDCLMAIALARSRSTGQAATALSMQSSALYASSTISRPPSIRESNDEPTANDQKPRCREQSLHIGVSIGVQTDVSSSSTESTGFVQSLRYRLAVSKKTRNRCIIALITLGSGFSMFINGIAGRILPPRPNAYTSTSTPLSLRIIASLPDPIYVLTSGRGISLLALLGCMLLMTGGRAQLDEISSRLLFPVAIGAFNGLGFCFFCALCAMGNVAIWSAMLAVWIVAPLSYGILVRHESAGNRKVVGAVFCMIAAIVLGLAGSGEGEGSTTGSEEGPVWLKLLLFMCIVSSWSVSDTLSAYVLSLQDGRGRSLGLVSVALFTAIGYLLFAWIAAGVSFLLSSLRPPVEVLLIRCTLNGTLINLPDGSSIDAPFIDSRSGIRPGGWEGSGVIAAYLAPVPSSVLSGNALMFAGNLVGALSWYGIVLLGSDPSAEASTFLPLTALDAFIPAILGTVFLGEPVGALGCTGMVIAAVGVFLIASSENSALLPPVQRAVQLHDDGREDIDARDCVATSNGGSVFASSQCAVP